MKNHASIKRNLYNSIKYAIFTAIFAYLAVRSRLFHPLIVCVLCVILCVFLFAGEKVALPWKRGQRILLALFSTALSACVIVGENVVYKSDALATAADDYLLPFYPSDALHALLLSALIFIIVRIAFDMLNTGLRFWHKSNNAIAQRLRAPLKIKHLQLLSFMLLLLSWSVYWLAHFPGTGTPDTLHILNDPFENSMYHPFSYECLLYGTMYVGKLLSGGTTAGAALYSGIQLLFCAWSLSYVIHWISQRGMPAILTIGIQLFFIFSKIVPAIVLVAAKDVIFSFSLLLFIPLLYECAETNGRSLLKLQNILLFLFASMASILIRNNGVFVIAGLAVFVVIVSRKYWKRILPLCLVAVLLPYGMDQALMRWVVHRDKDAVEALAIPLQQMAAVAARGGEMDERDAAIMETIMPHDEMISCYMPAWVDGIKWNEGMKYLNKPWIRENTGTFLKTWASLLLKNPRIYIEAYLLETLGYWNIGSRLFAQGLYYTYPVDDSSFHVHVDHTRVLPEALESTLLAYYHLNPRESSPSGGILIWLILLLMLYLACSQQNTKNLCLLPAVFVWGTLMVSSPYAFAFRYAYALYLMCPIVLPMIALPPVTRDQEPSH